MLKNQRRALARVAPAVAFALGIAGASLAAAADYPKYRIIELVPVPGSFVFTSTLNASGEMAGVASCDSACEAYLWKNDGTAPVNITALSGMSEVAPYALNNSGAVTGSEYFDAPDAHAFLWNGSTMRDLGALRAGEYSYGIAINSDGMVAGDSQASDSSSYRSFVWRNDGNPMEDIGGLGGARTEAAAMNESGQVTGRSSTARGVGHAFLWRNDGTPMQDLGALKGAGGYSQAYSINASGQVTGASTPRHSGISNHAFIWRNDGTRMVDLDIVSGPKNSSAGFKIDDKGQVVGYAGHVGHPYLWKSNGKPVDLGVLPGTKNGYATDINNSGWVVGSVEGVPNQWRAFLWRDDGQGMQDLDDLIDPADPLRPYVVVIGSAATDGLQINDAGDIAALGVDSRDGAEHYLLLRGSALVLAPRTLAFGNQKVATASAAQSVSVHNNDASPVVVAGITLTGTGAGQFRSTNNCGSSLAGKATCTVRVTFKPTATGPKSATLNVNGRGGGLRTVALAGTGT